MIPELVREITAALAPHEFRVTGKYQDAIAGVVARSFEPQPR